MSRTSTELLGRGEGHFAAAATTRDEGYSRLGVVSRGSQGSAESEQKGPNVAEARNVEPPYTFLWTANKYAPRSVTRSSVHVLSSK